MIGDDKMFICLECGFVFDEDDVATWKEDRGEYWGTPCYESVSGCPRCQGDYMKTYQCNCCENYIDGNYIKTSDGFRYCADCITHMELGDEE